MTVIMNEMHVDSLNAHIVLNIISLFALELIFIYFEMRTKKKVEHFCEMRFNFATQFWARSHTNR